MNKKTRNPELLILSDLHGLYNNSWIPLYVKALKNEFEISVYDTCKLAEIEPNITSKEKRHQAFINGGIGKAVDNLRKHKHHLPFIVGFSIGGTIAWKAVQLGMSHKALFAISATRLRYEHSKPSSPLSLYFGENDPFKPTQQWYSALEVIPRIIEGSHEFYRHKEAQRQIVSDLLKEKAALS